MVACRLPVGDTAGCQPALRSAPVLGRSYAAALGGLDLSSSLPPLHIAVAEDGHISRTKRQRPRGLQPAPASVAGWG